MQIAPEDFIKPSAEAIEDNINRKYSNKVSQAPLSSRFIHLDQVLQKIGLAICFYDLLETSDGFVGHDNTGTVNVNGELHDRVYVNH